LKFADGASFRSAANVRSSIGVKIVKIYLLIASLFLSLSLCLPAIAQQTDKPDSNPADSDEELRRAIERSGGSETGIIENLEEYMKKFPKSAHRSEIERQIYKLSIKVRDRNRAITYGEKLIASDEDSIDVLTNLVSMLRERRAEGDLNKALGHADELVKQVETILSSDNKPRRLSQAQWLDRKERGLASVYLVRGKVHSDLNNYEKAEADLLKSYRTARLAGAAITLGEIAEKRKKPDEAIDYYIQAFIITLATDEELDLKSVRSKLTELYTAKHGSEAGLGDRMLKTYDAFIKDRAERLAKIERPNPNEGVKDAMLFKLTRVDGSTLDMNSLRGKVIVINFWATWCGPCLTELPLFEKTITKFKDDKDVVFLALTTDEDRDLVPPYLKQYKFNIPVWHAEYLDDFFAITSIPTTIILDRAGQVTFRQAGYNPRADFVALLTEKIEETKKK
jgi:thiol-disulfide isomerase/thioredoxin